PNGISVDLARLEVHRDGQLIQLTPREGDILDYLIRNRHRVVTRDDLLLDVWHYKSANVETRTVDIHIVGLRRKVEPNPADTTLKRLPKVIVAGRHAPPKEAEIRAAVQFAALDLQRQATSSQMLFNASTFGYQWFTEDNNLPVPVLAINLADESNSACVREE